MSFFKSVGDNTKKFSSQGFDMAKSGANSASSFAGDIAKRPELDFSLPRECDKAAEILQSFLANPDDPLSALNSIPKAVLERASGLAVFRIIKAGFLVTGRAGSGIVIARLDDGTWSAPSCIATGVSWLVCWRGLHRPHPHRTHTLHRASAGVWQSVRTLQISLLSSTRKTQLRHSLWLAISL